MKKLFSLFSLIIITVGLFAQTVTYQDIVNQKSAKELTGRTGGDDISAYVASNGVTYTKGSTITYGYPTSGKYYVYFKDVTGSVLGSLAEDESTNASTSAANREVYERVENRAGGVATIKRIQCVPVERRSGLYQFRGGAGHPRDCHQNRPLRCRFRRRSRGVEAMEGKTRPPDYHPGRV